MKNIKKIFFSLSIPVLLLAACDKVADLPYYNSGNAPTLSTTATTIAPATADSLKPVVTFSWNSPGYATDTASVKYVIEIDSTSRNFSKALSRTVSGRLSTTFLAKEINEMLLALGFQFNKAYDVDVRLTSSYANNNEQYRSNVVKIKMTPYLTPPKVVPPASKTLLLVGSASAGGWGNPVPVPAQQFKRIDSVTYEGTFYLNGGQQYVFLPVNGDWTHKFNVADAGVPGLDKGGAFGADLGNANIPGPEKTGTYKITVDFQRGFFTVTQVKEYGILALPGDYQGWTPATAVKLGSPAKDGNYEGFMNLAGGTLEFKIVDGDTWYGDGGGGAMATGNVPNMKVPGIGYYRVLANIPNKTWSATKVAFSLIGSFAASNWNNDIDMVYNATDNNWKATITTAAGDQFKFRVNHDWGINYGETGGQGGLAINGDNIGDAAKNYAVPAGTHTITLYMNNAGYFTYNIQ
jgi:starch-binding outer membrane protein SusE/F